MDTRRTFLRVSLGVSVLLCTAVPGRSLVFTDPTNLVQNTLQAIQSLKSNINEALQIEQQIRSYVQQAKHLTTIPFSMVNQIQGLFSDYRSILSKAEGLGYQLQGAQTHFEQIYGAGTQIAGTDFRAMTGAWIASLKGAGKTAVAAQAVAGQLHQVEAHNRAALGLADSATGTLQVGQAQAQLLALLSQQNSALLEVQAASARVETEFVTQWVAAEQMGQVATDRWLTRDTTAIPAYLPPGQGQGGLPMGKMR